MDRDKLLKLWWVRALIFGVPFGVVMGLFAAHRGHGSGVADGLINGTISGALFGLAMAGSPGGGRSPMNSAPLPSPLD